jgi:hypothetical protein
VEKHRNRGLPAPIDAGVLERAGVSPSLIPRTLQALHILDLLTENGAPSDVLEGLRLAPEAEYKKRMGDWLAEAYHDALQFVDPATATETDIRDAFRKYVPTGQQDRMVSLFIGLFTAAGVMPPRQREPAPRKAGGFSAPKMQVLAKARAKPTGLAKRAKSYGGGGGTVVVQEQLTGLPPALDGLLRSLPANGRWTQEQRDKFYTAFGTILDFCFTIGEPEPEAADEEMEDEPMR